MSFKEKVKHFYETKYKWLELIPLLLLIGAILQIGIQTYTTGDFLNRGVSLKGGSTITINNVQGLDLADLEAFLKESYPLDDISIRTLSAGGSVSGIAIDSDIQDKNKIEEFVLAIGTKVDLQKSSYGVEVTGEALGSSFFRQAGIALLVSFFLMAIVVLLYFRVWYPSLAVIVCAFSDLVVTMAIFNLTGMKLSTAGVAAFLMLIGYSIDTDILLTSRVLHRKEGTVMDRIYSSISTGMTMTITTISVVLVALIFVQSETIRQIMLIVLIGMFVDMIMTWIQNVYLLRKYLERKEKHIHKHI
jgi:preprotein translocase subunit SecF